MTLENLNISFIGCGKMAGAIIKGIIKTGFIKPENIIASKSSPNNLDDLSKTLGIKIVLDNKESAKFGDVIIIAVKPNQVEHVLTEIKDFITPQKLIVSVAAGVKTSFMENLLPDKSKVIRVMPNTPVLVNEGMTGIAKGKLAEDEDINTVESIFNSIGKSIVVDEVHIDIVTAISGSGPAFFYKVINEIARAGENLGLDYEKALLLSIQTAIGASYMALNRSVTMEELISNVATKGGCTAVGVDVMESFNTKKLFSEVIERTAQKARQLG